MIFSSSQQQEYFPTDGEIRVAAHKIKVAYAVALAYRIDLSDIIRGDLEEIIGRSNIKELRALFDVIRSRMPGTAPESIYQ